MTISTPRGGRLAKGQGQVGAAWFGTMGLRAVAVFIFFTAPLCFPAQASPAASVQEEVTYLLLQIETSGCDFYRNGSWYDGLRTREHLRMKYDYLVSRNQIARAEDFIDKAATESTLSGQPYKIRCAGGAVVASSQWLREALEHYRATKPVE